MFLSGEGIYNNFQQAPGGAGLSNSAALVNELAKSYNAQADEIKRLVAATEAVWKGNASGAAQRGLGPLAVEHALAAPALATAQDLTSRQVGSFDNAKNRVIPVPPAPAKVDPLAAFMTPGALVTYGEQLGAHKAAAQHNVDVMRGYENASVYNMGMPDSFGQITDDQSEIRVAGPPPTGSGGGDDGGPSRPGSGPDNPNPPGGSGGQPGTGGSGPASGGSGSNTGSSADGGGSAVVAPPRQQGTTPGEYVPPAPPVGVPGGGLGGAGGPVGGVPQGGPGSGYLGGVIGPIGVPDGGAGSGGRGGSGAGAGLGAGGRGPGGGAGAGGPGTGSPGVGGRPGVGPVGPVGEPIAGQGSGARAGGVVGRGGPGGMPMGAVPGKGQGGEDEEHERASFLQEPDPESVFGTNEITAPPVIGGQP